MRYISTKDLLDSIHNTLREDHYSSLYNIKVSDKNMRKIEKEFKELLYNSSGIKYI